MHDMVSPDKGRSMAPTRGHTGIKLGRCAAFYLTHEREFRDTKSKSTRIAFSLVELLVVIAIIGILIALLVPAIQASREASRRTQCQNNLHQIGSAMVAYHSAQRHFPPAFLKPGNWGWSVWILPQMDEVALYQTLNPNTAVLSVSPDTTGTIPAFICPSDPAPLIHPFYSGYGKSDYAVSEQVCDGGSKIRISQITDGTSHTLMVGERDMQNQAGAIWAGRDTISGVASVIGRPTWPINTSFGGGGTCCTSDVSCTRYAWASMHPQGANFVFCDASVHFMKDTINTDPSQQNCNKPVPANFTFQNLYFRDDGNTISGNEF
jgi:prepilin-type N-terminal cleavage/methylation domain-containing protein/prepilin-type processing-associated H-X9-DG protein